MAIAIQRGTCRMLRSLGFAVLPEFTLASGRRADVVALKPDGEIWIVEIKSSSDDFYVDRKWPQYRDYCDRFYFAISPRMEQCIMPAEAGLILGDAYGADVVRDVAAHPLAAARRKAVTIAFARAAALRLHGLWDP